MKTFAIVYQYPYLETSNHYSQYCVVCLVTSSHTILYMYLRFVTTTRYN